MSATRFHKIYRHPDGQLVAGERVFGGPLGAPGEDQTMSPVQYGNDAYQMGTQYPMAGVPAPAFGARSMAQAPTRQALSQAAQAMSAQRGYEAAQQQGVAPGSWQKTVRTGQATTTAGAGSPFTITIRPQYDFVAQDLTFNITGGGVSALIQSVNFGDYIAWNDPVGVPTQAVAVTSFLRGVVKGAKIKGGLDITIQGVTVGGNAAPIIAVIPGLKPSTGPC